MQLVGKPTDDFLAKISSANVCIGNKWNLFIIDQISSDNYKPKSYKSAFLLGLLGITMSIVNV